MDIKIEKGHNRLIIEAYKGGKWVPVHWGSLGASTAGVSDAQKAMYANEPEVLRMLQLPGNGFIKCMRTFDPVTTNRAAASSSSRRAEKSALRNCTCTRRTPPKIWLSGLKLRPPAAGNNKKAL